MAPAESLVSLVSQIYGTKYERLNVVSHPDSGEPEPVWAPASRIPASILGATSSLSKIFSLLPPSVTLGLVLYDSGLCNLPAPSDFTDTLSTTTWTSKNISVSLALTSVL